MVRNAENRVLVVDDEEIVRESCRRALTEAGYTVRTAANGHDALQACRTESFDLMLTDLRMPDMDGLEVTRTVAEEFPDLRVVILTGYPSRDSAQEAASLGIFDYLEKPISPERLSAATASALARESRYEPPARMPEEAPAAPSASVRSASRREAPPTEASPEHVETNRMPSGDAEPTTAPAASVEASESVGDSPEDSDISTIEALGLLAIAPLLGLAFVIFLPVIGFAMLFVGLAYGLLGKLSWSQG